MDKIRTKKVEGKVSIAYHDYADDFLELLQDGETVQEALAWIILREKAEERVFWEHKSFINDGIDFGLIDFNDKEEGISIRYKTVLINEFDYYKKNGL
jgi:hypothetical protein